MIPDADAFHVLAADVEDAVNIRIKELGGVVVGYGLHLALIQHERRLDQRFAVTGGAGSRNCHAFGHVRIRLPDRPDGCGEGVAVVIVVK